MGTPSHTGNPNVDLAITAADGTRQAVVAAATTQAAANTAEITFYRAAKAAQLAAGYSVSNCVQALLALGTGGV